MQPEMQYIYEIWQTGSFSKAAQKIHVTQPALSIAVAKVEAAIGMPLFDRSTRPVTLTQAGKIYIDAVIKTQHLEQDLEQQFDDIRDLKKGQVVIGATHYINAYILAPLLKGFEEEFPGITLELAEGSAKDMLQLLRDRKIDLTLGCDPAEIINFAGYPVFSDTILLAVPEDDPAGRKHADAALCAEDILSGRHLQEDCPCLSLAAFRDEAFILLREGNNLYDRSMAMFQEAGITPRVKISISQLVTAYHLADGGYGLTFVSDRLIRSAGGHLVYFKIDSALIYRRFYALLNNQRYISHAVQAFIEYLQDCLS